MKLISRSIIIYLFSMLITSFTASLALSSSNQPHLKGYQEATLIDADFDTMPLINYVALLTGHRNLGNTKQRQRNLNQEIPKPPFTFIIKINDTMYQTEYPAALLWSRPLWVIGDTVMVKRKKRKLYIKKSNGKDMKTRIVKMARLSKFKKINNLSN